MHGGQRTRLAFKLLAGLRQVVQVQVRIAERVDEFARFQAGHPRDHHRQQRVRGDVERHAQKHVRAALVQLAREPSLGDVELEQHVARRQGHLGQLADIPRRHD